VWAPALAAWGARIAPAAAADAPALGLSSARRAAVPALTAVGQGSTGAIADPGATGSLQAPELAPSDEVARWVPAFAFHSGILGQNADASIRSASTVTYDYILRATDGGLPAFSVSPPQVQRVTRSLSENKSNTVGFAQTARFPPPPDSRGLVFVPNSGQVITGGSPVTGPFPRLPVVTVVSPPVLPAQGSTTFLTPIMGASLELMTPGLQDLGGRPRLFAHAGAATAFSFDRDTAKEGIPGDVEYPIAPGLRFGEGEIKGIGSETSGEVQTLVLSAGLGTAFTLDAFERRLRIKPSIEWMRQEIKVSGRLVRVYRKDTGTGTGSGTAQPASSFFLQEPIDIQADDTRPFHGIGPGLEVEMDAGRAGPVVLSLFLSGQAYYMLGNRDVQLTGTDQITDPALVPTTQTVSADFDFNIHQWSYQGGMGIRFRWVPED
jgi:hypothetical protein